MLLKVLRKKIRQVNSSDRVKQLESVIDLLRLHIGDRSLSRTIKQGLSVDKKTSV
jgi:hypothetical protein